MDDQLVKGYMQALYELLRQEPNNAFYVPLLVQLETRLNSTTLNGITAKQVGPDDNVDGKAII